jgi:hypothetical protein
MVGDPNGSAAGVPFLFNLGFLAALLFLARCRRAVRVVAHISGRAKTWADGYLTRRPEPFLEARLREAFTEIDRDLAAILQNETPAR